jgi:hypothetical protein
MKKEMAGVWLLQTDHVRDHPWDAGPATVKKVMITPVKIWSNY